DLLIHVGSLVHRRKKWNVAPKFEPLPVKKAGGDDELAFEDFLVVVDLGIFFDELLVIIKSNLILLLRFVTAADEVLGMRSVIGERPLRDGAARGLEGRVIVLLIERFLGHAQLVLRATALPFAFRADLLIGPAFARFVDQRRRALVSERRQKKCNQKETQ